MNDPSSSRPRRAVDPVRARHATLHELAGRIVSVAALVGRPVRDAHGDRVGRVDDVVVRWSAGASHPPLAGVRVKIGRALELLAAGDIELEQRGVRIRSSAVVVNRTFRPEDGVLLAHDVLDRQLIDVAGVQVVRAADVYLVNTGDGWQLGGIDVGHWALLRRVLPGRRRRAVPGRVIDWADLQAFVGPHVPVDGDDAASPGTAAGVVGSSVRLSGPAGEVHKFRAQDIARLLDGLGRRQQAELATMADPAAVGQALRELDPAKLAALLGELDDADRARLQALVEGDAAS